ncbi:hypothetical protein [Saccharomonospora iraqiensis]|uniref:hypothetical protein n=1 Tax=Saccharomonospora iraqiensis TaxID=52698 RepID=UPI000403654E|nr:hypothetical protein [Saccharomonospora iraqiensis]
MAEDRERTPGARESRTPDVFTLLAGVATLLVAAYLLADGASWMPDVDPRWLVAGGATLTGTLLLIASLLTNRRSS